MGTAQASIDPAEGVQQASTTSEGGILHGMPGSMPQALRPPDLQTEAQDHGQRNVSRNISYMENLCLTV